MGSSEPSDDELVRRTLAGEGGAFAQLVTKHQRLVYGVALSHARDVAQAEEVAQEAFVEAWRELPRLRDPARLGAWLAGIARNVARSWGRHTSRRRRREVAALPAIDAAEPTPLDHALERETVGLLRHALAAIPAAYREALVLFYVHGQSVAQMATALGISEELAKQRLSRGRRALRASLESRLEGTLAQLGPGKGFATTVMVAVGAAAARKTAAASVAAGSGKALLAMNATKLAAIGVVLVLALGVAWHARSTAGREQPPTTARPTAPSVTVARTPVDAAPSTRRTKVHELATRADYAPLVEAIRNARRERTARPPEHAGGIAVSLPRVGSGSADDGAAEDPDESYVRDAVKDLLPMIRDCYQQARARQPELTGKLVVHFVIEGEPEIGGVVTDSAVDLAKIDIKDAQLGHCIEQAMFELEIDPPSAGMKVDVTFPFTFSSHN